jgi:hypothetical protein
MILLTVLEVYGGEIWRGGRGALSKSREERERRGAAGADLSERGGVESALFISGRSNFFVALLVSASPIYRLPWFGWWVGGSGRGGGRRERRRCARCHESSVSFSPLVRCGEERKCRALLGQRNGKGGPGPCLCKPIPSRRGRLTLFFPSEQASASSGACNGGHGSPQKQFFFNSARTT